MIAPMPAKQQVFALTICAYRKPGMSEEAYHEYISEKHAPQLLELLVEKKIVDYTMVHNTSEAKKLMGQIFGNFPETSVADYDAFIQITFRDPQDYISVKQDPHYKRVVMPDHENFADMKRTTMVTGWMETHLTGGQIV